MRSEAGRPSIIYREFIFSLGVLKCIGRMVFGVRRNTYLLRPTEVDRNTRSDGGENGLTN
jgi:hypothetical protein